MNLPDWMRASLAWSDESTILRFRHLLRSHNLSLKLLVTINALLADKDLRTALHATLIEAQSSTKNSSDERDPEMHPTKKGNQWHFGMKAHIGMDTAANVNDVTQGHALLHGEETDVFADAGYLGARKRPKATEVN